MRDDAGRSDIVGAASRAPWSEQLPAMLMSVDVPGHVLAVSNRLLERLKLEREAMVGRHLSDLVDDPESGRAAGALADLVAADGHGEVELPFREGGGGVATLTLRASLERDEAGRPARLHAVLDDPGALRQARSEAERAHRRLIDAVESLGDGFSLFDAEGRFVLCNEAYRRLYDDPPGLLVPGRSYAEILRHRAERGVFNAIDDIDAFVARYVRMQEEGHPPREIQLKGGRWILLRTSRTPGGEIVGLRTDITVQKNVQAELRQRNQELARSNEELERYMYLVAHDMRVPLHSLALLVEWCREDWGDGRSEALREHLEQMRRQVERLSRLLDDTLEHAVSSSHERRDEAIDLDLLLDRVVAELAIPESFMVRREAPLGQVNGDPLVFATILRNALDNAVKHHDRGAGGIDVAAGREAGWLEMTISDDGPGVAPSHRARVFEMFNRLRSKDELEGSGLGLSIVKKLVTARGGDVAIDDNPSGRGARLRVMLPLVAEPGTDPASGTVFDAAPPTGGGR